MRIFNGLWMMGSNAASIGYYFYFRKAVLSICDPKYYRIDSVWLQQRLLNYKMSL
jgi:hypothetical protein